MIKALELENFKAFGARTRIEFTPITLIYGQNSAGKSSILNALNLLKQTRMIGDPGALLQPRAENGIVDLGSFHELLHDHDASKTLSMRLDVESSGRRRQAAARAADSESVGFEVGFRRDQDCSDVRLAYVQAFATGASDEPTLRYEPREIAREELREWMRGFGYPYWRSSRRLSPKDFKVARCVSVTRAREFWRVGYEAAVAAAPDVVRALEFLLTQRTDKSGQESLFPESVRDVDQIQEAVSFYKASFAIEDYIERRCRIELAGIVGLDGFLPMPMRREGSTHDPESLAFRYLREGRTGRPRISDASDLLIEAGRSLELELERLFPLGPYRRAPERLYIFTGTTPMDVGYSGRFLPDLLFRRPGLIEKANGWLQRLDIGYELQISPVGTPSNDLFEVRLRDTRRGNAPSVALPDVGFGISQILPFLVQILASEEQTLTIEQPEVHIHPKLQADLADLLVEGIQAEPNHRFIIETHSEHLILRLLRRIRETTEGSLPEGICGLAANQVSVVYVERGSAGTEVRHLRVDDNGEFIDRWPHGFFEERARELF